MKKICWVTADCFVDVDLPIVPELAKQYNIKWNIIIAKNAEIDYFDLVNNKMNDSEVGLQIIHFKNRMRNPLLFFEYYKLIVKLKKQKADLYYIDMPGMPYFLPLVRLFIGKKKAIIAAHNVSTPKGAANHRLADLYMKFTLHFFLNFHVFSKNQNQILISKYSNKNILLAPLALKDFGVSNKPNTNIITFLNFGIIRDYKRIDVLIEAANIAYEKTKKTFIVKIAGKCDDWTKYERLIKYPFLFDLRIESIPNEDIPDLFASSHYFVLPYQDIAQSGALTVAFNYNLPVIASNLDSFKEFIINNKTGFLFETASVNSLVEIMEEILNKHNTVYPELKTNLQQFVNEKYSMESIINNYKEYFDKLLVQNEY